MFNASEDVVRQRLVNTLSYLLEIETLTKKPAFSIADHERPYFWEHQILNLPGIKLRELDADAWLTVSRLTPSAAPSLPELLSPFVRVWSDPDREPVLDTEELEEKTWDEDGDFSEADKAALVRMFSDYLSQWRKWAEKERPRRKTIEIYEKLFAVHRAIDADSATDPVELVWGIGIGIWRSKEKTIRYPVVCQLVELELADDMSIVVRPRDAAPVVETTPYLALEHEGVIPARDAVNEFFTKAEASLNPHDPTTFSGALSRFTSLIDSRAIYWPEKNEDKEDRTLPPAEDRLKVTDTWVLFVRPRSSHYFIQDVEELRRLVVKGAPLGEGAATIFDDPSETVPVFKAYSWKGVSTPVAFGGETRDLYFPKPYNEEQVTIAERLEQTPGVVAQGPPGTGKSHTIANIICHYLATGKRVLVTSKGEQALSVLQEKLPEDIRPLAISLLSNDRLSLHQMEESVLSISSRIDNLNKAQLDADISAEKRRIDRLCADIAANENEIKDCARNQLAEVSFRGRTVQPEQLARMLMEDKGKHDWLPGTLKTASSTPMFSEEDVCELRQARVEIGQDLPLASWTLPASCELPSREAFGDLHVALCRHQSLVAKARSHGLPGVSADLSAEGILLARELHGLLNGLLTFSNFSADSDTAWMSGVWEALKSTTTNGGGRTATVLALRDYVFAAQALEQQRTRFVAEPVSIPGGMETDADFGTAVERLASGEKAFSLFSGIGKGHLKKGLADTRVCGEPASSLANWKHVQDYLAFAALTRKATSRWKAFEAEFGLKSLIGGNVLESSREVITICAALTSMFNFVENGWPTLKESFVRVFPNSGAPTILLLSNGEIYRHIAALETHIEQASFALAQSQVADLKRSFGRHSNPLAKQARELIAKLGDSETPGDLAEESWDAIVSECRRLETFESAFATLKRVCGLIRKSGAAEWADALETSPATSGADTLLPDDWRETWEWRRLLLFLEEIDARAKLSRIAEKLKEAENALTRANERLVELLVWRRFSDMPPSHQQALNQYAIAVRRIGRGTGKIRAPKYRLEAREHMRKAVAAVPCWIMPHWRVSETLPSQFECFDLVIVDEASQSDISALPVLLRGKKILVVGDDKQVSPTSIGTTQAMVTNLSRKYLSGFDLGKRMTPEDSIYDLSKVAFPTGNICLREHFRCVEPIIQFSNRVFYGNRIVPLRLPLPSERITPPLVDVFVKDGYRSGKSKINQPEAMAIAKEVKALVDDPVFAGKSVGIVTLLGHGQQSKLIDEYLRDLVGEEAILRHHITCGEPPTFQGNERDIMFLSLVDDAESVIAKTGTMWEQRINVAASRAKDRMYLYRSFSRADIRNPQCLFSRLLDHFENPLITDSKVSALSREACESDFERKVFDALVGRGYRVTPQVKVGPYRIDMVVEGVEDRRLAIECDGDAYHGPDRYSDDLLRQRILERAGWTFWRCWGSSFYRDPEACLEDLFATLDRMGIAPLGSSETAQAVYVERRVVYGLTEPQEAEDGEHEPDVPVSEPVSTRTQPIPIHRPPKQVALPLSDDAPLFSRAAAGKTENKPPSSAGASFAHVVEVGDTVKYCYVDEEENVRCVQIHPGLSMPNMGIVGAKTPLALALLDAEAGEDVEVALPTGMRKARIIDIVKAA